MGTRAVTCAVCELHAESVFKIEGMDCHEEVAILDRRLRRLGVEDVSADLVAQRLNVKYDAARLTASAIREAVAETGMRAWLEHEEPIGPPLGSAWKQQTLISLSGASLLVGFVLELIDAPQ